MRSHARKSSSATKQVKMTVLAYDEAHLQESQPATAGDLGAFKGQTGVAWINVEGIHEPELIQDIGWLFELHPLTVEDILNPEQRAKVDDFTHYLFLVVKMLSWRADTGRVVSEQVSLVLGSNYVISFQEGIKGDVFEGVRGRIRNAKGHIRQMGADYLVYCLVDALMDSYFTILEALGERIAVLEEELVTQPKPETLRQIHELKRELILLRKSVWPLREAVSGLQRLESPLLKDSTRVYLRSIYDHTIEVIDSVETFRDMVSGMLDIYVSSISYKLNEVMKVLTVIATIFIPLTFIAGVYGMNFSFMPETRWRFGYPLVLFMMWVICALMLVYFRKRKWL